MSRYAWVSRWRHFQLHGNKGLWNIATNVQGGAYCVYIGNRLIMCCEWPCVFKRSITWLRCIREQGNDLYTCRTYNNIWRTVSQKCLGTQYTYRHVQEICRVYGIISRYGIILFLNSDKILLKTSSRMCSLVQAGIISTGTSTSVICVYASLRWPPVHM